MPRMVSNQIGVTGYRVSVIVPGDVPCVVLVQCKNANRAKRIASLLVADAADRPAADIEAAGIVGRYKPDGDDVGAWMEGELVE